MTPQQQHAFESGSGFTADIVLLGIASVVLTIALVWAAWMAFGSLRSWNSGQIELADLMWNVLRTCIVLAVLGFYIR